MGGVVSGINQILDSVGSSAVGHHLHVHIDAFLLLPRQPLIERVAVGEGGRSDHEHLHWTVVEIGMCAISILDGPAVEQLLVDDVEVGAVGLCVQVVGGLLHGTVELHLHLDVVEHTHDVLHRVIAHRLDGHLGYAHTTHGAHHLNHGRWFGVEAIFLVGRLVVDKGNIVGGLVLSQRGLARRHGLDAVVVEQIVVGMIALHLDVWRGAYRNGNELVDDRNFGIALIAADDGVGHTEQRELTGTALVVLSLKHREGERSTEARHIAFLAFGASGWIQLNLLLCHDVRAKHQEKNHQHNFQLVSHNITFRLLSYY